MILWVNGNRELVISQISHPIGHVWICTQYLFFKKHNYLTGLFIARPLSDHARQHRNMSLYPKDILARAPTSKPSNGHLWLRRNMSLYPKDILARVPIEEFQSDHARQHQRMYLNSIRIRAHWRTFKWPPFAAYEHVYVFHSHPCARAHFKTFKWPPLAASQHVLLSHGHLLALAHSTRPVCHNWLHMRRSFYCMVAHVDVSFAILHVGFAVWTMKSYNASLYSSLTPMILK